MDSFSNGFTHGPAFNREFLSKWLQPQRILPNLIFRKLNIKPFTNGFSSATIPAAVYIACSARLQCNRNFQTFGPAEVMSLTLGELLPPIFPDTLCMNEVDARAELVRIVTFIIDRPHFDKSCMGDLKFADYPAFVASNFDPQDIATMTDAIATSVEVPTPAMTAEMTPIDAAALLSYFATKSPRFGKDFLVSLVTSTILGVVKRGSVSTKIVTYIQNDDSENLTVNVDIDCQALPIFYRHFGWYLNENNVTDVANQWEEWLPAMSQKLTTLVQRASFSPLAAFLITYEAINRYTNFPWHKVAHVLPLEYKNFEAAMTIVDGNPYYGFRINLGIADSKNYKSLTWVCKELLIHVGGMDNLKYYRGWISKPICQNILQALINKYITEIA